MNWLDILLLIINIIVIVTGIILIPVAIIRYNNDSWSDMPAITISYWVIYLCLGWLLLIPFIVIDKHSGATVGTITSVDKNFFGTTALYIKTIENKEEKYCIEFDEELETQANKYIGEKVKISYGKRVGFYSTGKCSQAPIEKIELLKSN
ncbi:MAG: hypothetical protein J6T23_02655 [Elusimicrobia bacterium]|nr:hypothetical protein [Elusimicrobiota bacterium]